MVAGTIDSVSLRCAKLTIIQSFWNAEKNEQSICKPRTFPIRVTQQVSVWIVWYKVLNFNCVSSPNLWCNEITTLSNAKSEKVIDYREYHCEPEQHQSIASNWYAIITFRMSIPKTLWKTNELRSIVVLFVIGNWWISSQFARLRGLHWHLLPKWISGYWQYIWFSVLRSYRMQKHPRTSCLLHADMHCLSMYNAQCNVGPVCRQSLLSLHRQPPLWTHTLTDNVILVAAMSN